MSMTIKQCKTCQWYANETEDHAYAYGQCQWALSRDLPIWLPQGSQPAFVYAYESDCSTWETTAKEQP